MNVPGYDNWKLANPYGDEMEGIECEHCGRSFHHSEVHEHNWEILCESCLRKEEELLNEEN